MSRIIPLTGPEAARTTQAAQVSAMELHSTSDQGRLFLENAIVAPHWHGSVADETAMLRLANRHSGTGVSAAAGDNSLNDASGFPGDWTGGDIITVDGFTDPANNGTTFEIASRTSTKLVLTGGSATLVTEAAGATITITRNGQPGCWPGDKCKRTDIGTIWECVANNGKTLSDWIEVTTDRIGTIRMWSGSLSALPTGYALCDGTGGTPDLQDKFMLGKGAGSSIGDTGGSASHSHALSGGTATAAVAGASAGTPAGSVTVTKTTATDTATTGAGTRLTDASATFSGTPMGDHAHTLSGSTDGASALPPYYVLAFIKRVS